jgi:hypothetical protein
VTTFSPHLRKGTPDCQVTVFPDGNLLFQIGSQLVYSGGELDDLPLEKKQELERCVAELVLSEADGDRGALFIALPKAIRELRKRSNRGIEVLAKGTLKWPFLALMVLTLSWVLLGHGAKRSRNLRGATA